MYIRSISYRAANKKHSLKGKQRKTTFIPVSIRFTAIDSPELGFVEDGKAWMNMEEVLSYKLVQDCSGRDM